MRKCDDGSMLVVLPRIPCYLSNTSLYRTEFWQDVWREWKTLCEKLDVPCMGIPNPWYKP